MCCPQFWFCFDIIGLIQCILSVIAIGLAWLIPTRIMWHQTYSDLIKEYRSYDFGVAVQGLVEFFINDCKSSIDNIKTEYEHRYLQEIGLGRIKTTQPQLCLHYQRRLLSQFFYQLDLCAKTHFIGQKQVLKDFSKNEANLVRIIYLINNAIDESDIVKKDISCDSSLSSSKGKGLNKSLSHIYSLLKHNSTYMGEL